MKYVRLLLVIMAVNLIGSVKSQTLSESLLQCDDSFFSELYLQRSKFKNAAPISTDNQHHAWFTAPRNGDEIIWFAQPVRMQKLTFSGYFLQQSDLDEFGKYYYWGLIIDESPETVMSILPKVNWQKSGDEFFANPMIKRPGDSDWQENTAAVEGIAPAKGSVEKLSMIRKDNGRTYQLCTIQGGVTNAVLLPLRPDLVGEKND